MSEFENKEPKKSGGGLLSMLQSIVPGGGGDRSEGTRVPVEEPRNADRDKFEKEPVAGAASQGMSKMEVFDRWLLESGSQYPQLEMQAYDSEVRGVHAAENIDADSTIVEVPLKCLITVEMGKATAVGRAVLAAGLELDAPKHVFLMLFMLIDRKDPSSFFKPYYDILPPTLSNMPIFWTEEELGWLKGSYLLQQIDQRRAAIERDYAAICDIAPEFCEVSTLQEFMWARMCVCSRNFGIVVDGIRTAAMVPYADMLNHFRPRETKWTYDNGRGAFTITTLQRIRVGAQVYDSYGQKCNHRFLLNYGFAIENNREADGFCPNEVPFALALKSDDPIAGEKGPFWARDACGEGVRRVRVCVSDNENTRAAFSLLRVIVADAKDFGELSGGNPWRQLSTAKDVRRPLSPRNERAVLELMRDTCREQLDAYPTSLAEDQERLRDPSLAPFSNERHARIQVCGEKEVLHHYLEHATEALALFALDAPDAFARKLAEIRETLSAHIAAYCAEVVQPLKQREGREAADGAQ